MNYWIENYIFVLVIAVMMVGIIIPKILLIAFRMKLFDEVDERKIHKGVVPRLGGIAFLPAIAFSICLVIGINLKIGQNEMFTTLSSAAVPVCFWICAQMLIYLVGLADDLIGVRYRAKFIAQIIAAALIISSGIYISNLHGFLWIEEWPSWIGWIITTICIIYAVNAVNLIDGIDGLASGLSAVALIWYSYAFYVAGEYVYMLLAGATLGTLVPFFYYNVFGRASGHKKIFMGDTGSLTIGLILAFLAIKILDIDSAEFPRSDNMFIIAVVPLIIPCFDVVRVFIHRLRRGKNPFLPDKSHIHHKLLALGFVQWQALVAIIVTDMVFVLINVGLSPIIAPHWILIGDVALWAGLNWILSKIIHQREKLSGETLYE